MEKLRETLRVRKERAILVAAVLRGSSDGDDLAELTSLAESAGAVVVDRFQQKIRTINPSTYIGKGKVDLLAGRLLEILTAAAGFSRARPAEFAIGRQAR